MVNFMKKIIFIFFAFILQFIFALTTFAENFYITNYDVTLDVKANKDIIVTEKIDVYFTKPSHGIYRTIPLKGKLYYEGVKSSLYKARISDIAINNKYSKKNIINKRSKYLLLKIGDKKKYVDGAQQYEIKYKYSLGNDKLENADELYFNIIGTEWMTGIDNVDFKVIFPKVDYDLLGNTGFSLGKTNTSGYEPQDITFSVEDNNVIVGRVNRLMLGVEGLTIRTLLPEGYFDKSFEFPSRLFVLILISILTLIPFIMWFMYGRDEKIIPVVSFYPPANKNSAEVEVIFDGCSSDKGIISLILLLASKGFIQIEDNKDSFTLHKIKKYDGENKFEKSLMSALFLNKKTIDSKELEKSNTFYEACDLLKDDLNELQNFIFDASATNFKKISIILGCTLGILCCLLYCLGDYTFDIFTKNNFGLIVQLIIAVSLVGTFFSTIFVDKSRVWKKVLTFLFLVLCSYVFIFGSLIKLMSQSLLIDFPISIYSLVAVFVVFVCFFNMQKRSKLGLKEKGEILGFKKFLEVAEKHQLELLVSENPNYISEIIPYAYILGVLDKIMPILENINLYNKSEWYSFLSSRSSFSRFDNSMMKIVGPTEANGGVTSSSGGRGGRGGRAGGGAGGGGGGSW